MQLEWTTGALAQGLQCYQNREFFDAHEHWEGVWLRCHEPEKTFLQALIQIAAAFHHLERGNCVGTASLLRRAVARLDTYPAVYEGVAVEALRAAIREWLASLERDVAGPQPPFPLIR
jgi:predicted metal-dependent hydrolase